MNTLLQTAVSTWEMHNENNVASNLIVDGLIALQQGKNNTSSPEAFELNPVVHHVETPKADNILSTLFESLSRTLKASA